tara:strand:- start:6806 stop:7429 length:624 start_codon:yes stop_codon:yes gene_type:complete
VPSNESGPQQDLALAERMLRGDEAAVNEFCKRYLPRLYRFALYRVATPEDADDVVQIVLSNAARRIETYRGQSTLQAWLTGICRREISKHLASLGRQPVVSMFQGSAADEVADLPGPVTDRPDELTANGELSRLVHEALDRLPERQAAALELMYVDGYSSKEIARRLDVSDEAVQSLLARARRGFREVCDDRIVEAMGSANGAGAEE